MRAKILAVYFWVFITGGMLTNVWSAPEQVFRLADKAQIGTLAFSPDGKTLAVSRHIFVQGGFVDAAVELWNPDGSKRLKILKQKAWNEDVETNTGMYVVGAVEFSPDGKWLVATDGNGYVVWEVGPGDEKVRWPSGVFDNGIRAGWSADSKWLALPSMEQEKFGFTNGIAVIEFDALKRTAFFLVELGYARTARISADSSLLVTAGHDCTVRVFDLRSRTNLYEDFVQTTMFAAAISPDGRKIIAGSSWGGVLLRYEVGQVGGKTMITKKGMSDKSREEIHLVEFTPDGARAISTSNEGIRFWETKNWKMGKQIKGCNGRLSADGTRIALVRSKTPNAIEVWKFNDLLRH